MDEDLSAEEKERHFSSLESVFSRLLSLVSELNPRAFSNHFWMAFSCLAYATAQSWDRQSTNIITMTTQTNPAQDVLLAWQSAAANVLQEIERIAAGGSADQSAMDRMISTLEETRLRLEASLDGPPGSTKP